MALLRIHVNRLGSSTRNLVINRFPPLLIFFLLPIFALEETFILDFSVLQEENLNNLMEVDVLRLFIHDGVDTRIILSEKQLTDTVPVDVIDPLIHSL